MNSNLTTSCRRLTVLVILTTMLVTPLVPTAAAEDSTILRISKSTIYGGLLGLLLGAAVAIVVDDNRDEPIRWGLVIGVFGGFGYGIYSASTGRDDFFLQADASRAESSRYLLPGAAKPAGGPRAATPLRPGSEGRSEFSPFAAPTAE